MTRCAQALPHHLSRSDRVAIRIRTPQPQFSAPLALDPENPTAYCVYAGSPTARLVTSSTPRTSRETKPEHWEENKQCLAVTYDKLRRHGDAESILRNYRPSWVTLRRTSTPRSMRSGATNPKRSHGSTPRCGCGIRGSNSSRPIRPWTRRARSRASKGSSGN